MCGIVGGRDPEKVLSLLDEVSQRGTKAVSITLVGIKENVLYDIYTKEAPYKRDWVAQRIADLWKDRLAKNPVGDPYWIVHLQSPTASNSSEHPARTNGLKYALWHNGMLEAAELEKFKNEKGGKPWDTELLLGLLMTGEMKAPPLAPPFVTDIAPASMSQERRLEIQRGPHHGILSQTAHLPLFQGSFACLYFIDGLGLYAFRNQIAPLFHDSSSTVCSIMFEGAKKVEPNTVYSVPNMEPIGIFDNDYNPFGV